MKNALIFVILALFLAACNAPFGPAPTPTTIPTQIPSNTPEPTQSPTPTPSNTPTPTFSPTPTSEATLLPTPAFLFLLPTLTATPIPAAELDCKLVTRSVVNEQGFNPRESFSVSWTFTNTGSAGWGVGSVDFAYVGGAQLQQIDLVHLQKSVVLGEIVSFSVDMRSPGKVSSYTTFWSLRRGTTYFCHVSLTIEVFAQ